MESRRNKACLNESITKHGGIIMLKPRRQVKTLMTLLIAFALVAMLNGNVAQAQKAFTLR